MKFFSFIFWISLVCGGFLAYCFEARCFLTSAKIPPSEESVSTNQNVSSNLTSMYSLIKEGGALRDNMNRFHSIDSVIKYNIQPSLNTCMLRSDTSNLKIIARRNYCENLFLIKLEYDSIKFFSNIYSDSLTDECNAAIYEHELKK
jgi:hypothetical protein